METLKQQISRALQTADLDDEESMRHLSQLLIRGYGPRLPPEEMRLMLYDRIVDGDLEGVRNALIWGANITQPDEDFFCERAMHLALGRNKSEIALLLLEEGIVVPKDLIEISDTIWGHNQARDLFRQYLKRHEVRTASEKQLERAAKGKAWRYR